MPCIRLAAWPETSPVWACHQPLGRVCMTTPHPHLYSSLPIVTCSTGRLIRLEAYRLSFPLSTMDDQSHAEGRCCLPFTGEVRVDDSPCSEYHLTHMDTQLSRFKRSMTAQPCRSSLVPFDGTISSERVAPRACSRPPTRAANRGAWLGYHHSWVARLACDRRRLMRLPLGGSGKVLDLPFLD